MKRKRQLDHVPATTLPSGSVLVKACSRCQERKVKCDGRLPQCSACIRGDYDECNVVECVMWTRDHVNKLEDRIRWLEQVIGNRQPMEVRVEELPTGSELPSELPNDQAGFAEEVGLLNLRAGGCYMGSMSGITIATLMASAVHFFSGQSLSVLPTEPSFPSSKTRASFPPLKLAAGYIQQYLNRVHKWYPFLDLEDLAQSITQVYDSHSTASEYSRFEILMICALGEIDKEDAYTSEEYYLAAVPFIPSLMTTTSLDTLRAMCLLTIWGTRTWYQEGPYSVNCWRIIGQALRIGIEMGLTRNLIKANFSRKVTNARRCVWWSLYSLERFVATASGRILSIRNEGIDADFPISGKVSYPDSLCDVIGLPGGGINMDLSLHLVRQRRLLGDILECVYITRPRNRPSLSLQETTERVFEIQGRLIAWQEDTLCLTIMGSVDRIVLQIAFHHATLVLHRPSPSFPAPPNDVIDICLGAARAMIQLIHQAVIDGNIEEILPGWSGLANLFMSGITLLYCSWACPDCLNAVRPSTGSDYPDDSDLRLSLTTMESLARSHPIARSYVAIFVKAIHAFSGMLVTPLNRTFGPPQLITESVSAVTQSAGLTEFEGLFLDQDAIDYLREFLVERPTGSHDTTITSHGNGIL